MKPKPALKSRKNRDMRVMGKLTAKDLRTFGLLAKVFERMPVWKRERIIQAIAHLFKGATE